MNPLRKGDRGPEVRKLQEKLIAAGYPIRPDAHFGDSTDTALRAFQDKKGLIPDGVAGTNTWHALGVIDKFFMAQKPKYPNSLDPTIAKVVAEYNKSNGLVPGSSEYLDPKTVRAMIRVESGTNMNAYENDPMQVNVPGDWVPEKSKYGLTRGQVPGATLSIEAGVEWLSYKAYEYDATGTPVRFRGWDAAVTRYNGGGDPDYLSKYKDQLSHLP